MSGELLIAQPGGTLAGRLAVPGDKSISHRAVMLGALAEGITEVRDCLLGEDVRATMAAFRAMGVQIEELEAGRLLRIHGAGLQGLRAPATLLDCGNSGTSMRLLCGILAGAGLPATLSGDESLCRRPMRRVTEPLARMGAQIDTAEGGTPPLRVHAGRALQGVEYVLPVASAQVKSALLLAGLYAAGETCVVEPAVTRDHSERMLRGFGVSVKQTGARVCVKGGQTLRACSVTVPGDISSAAFFLVGAALHGQCSLTVQGVGINPTRTGVLDILRQMGARLSLSARREVGGEPVADITVHPAPLHGAAISPELVPLAIDEFPALFVAAACAEGRTVVTGAEELRHKESDRIETMAAGLRTLGVKLETLPDGMVIDGRPRLGGGCVDAHGDHRIAMAFAIASLRAEAPIEIRGAAAIATSFPDFVTLARASGLCL